jgi:PKD repeat protein
LVTDINVALATVKAAKLTHNAAVTQHKIIINMKKLILLFSFCCLAVLQSRASCLYEFAVCMPECYGDPITIVNLSVGPGNGNNYSCTNPAYPTITNGCANYFEWHITTNMGTQTITTTNLASVVLPASWFNLGQTYSITLYDNIGGIQGFFSFVYPTLPQIQPGFTMNGSSANSITICEGQTINFQDVSTIINGSFNAIDQHWNFGDGNQTGTGNIPTTSHTYTNNGTYTVVLTLQPYNTSGNPCSPVIITKTVIVNELNSIFTAPGTLCFDQQPVLFTNASTCYTSLLWNFGDGGTSTATNPSHSYSAPGTYTVTLTAFNGAVSDVSTQTVTILAGPSVTINGLTQICSNDLQTTHCASLSGNNFTYNWSATGGTIIGYSGMGTLCPIVNWSPAGGTLTLTMTNNLTGCSTTTSINVTVLPAPPVQINGLTTICPDDLTWSYASGINGNSSWLWSITGGTILSSPTAGLVNVQWPPTGGTLTLNITNNLNGCSSETTIAVNVVNLHAAITGPTTLCNGQNASYQLTSPALLTHTYFWQATGGSIVGPNNGSSVNVNWSPAGGTVCLIESTPEGCHDTVCLDVVPCCNMNVFIESSDACISPCDGYAQVMVTGSSAPYLINWSNGATGSYVQNLCTGNYSVTVTDTAGCIATGTFTIGATGNSTLVTTFNPSVDYTMALGERVYLFDINDDGDDDLVTVNGQQSNGSGVTIRYNQGSPANNTPATVFDNSPNPTLSLLPGVSVQALDYADVNNDGIRDLICQSWTDVHILLNSPSSPGTFTATTPISLVNGFNGGGYRGGFECKDLDNNGYNDVLVLNGLTNEVYIYYNTAGTFNTLQPDQVLPGPPAISYWEAKLADMDNDGDLDVVCGQGGGANSMFVYTNLLGSFNPAYTLYNPSVPGWPRGIDVSDMDNSGTPDFIMTTQDYPNGNNSQLLVNLDVNNPGAVWLSFPFPLGDQPVGQVVADIDNDGDMDVAVAVHFPSSYIRLFFNDGTGNLPTFADYTTTPQTHELAIGDLNGDCCKDMVTANSGSLSSTLFLNTCTTGLGIQTTQGNDEAVQVYPNPSLGEFNLVINMPEAEGKIEIQLVNVLGSTLWVMSEQLVGDTYLKTIDISHLASGSYLLKITMGEHQFVKRIVKN